MSKPIWTKLLLAINKPYRYIYFLLFLKNTLEFQANLRNAYRGTKKHSVGTEEAIACYHRALQIYTSDSFPEDYAKVQYSLGLAYQMRIQGENYETGERNSLACCSCAYTYSCQRLTRIDYAKAQMILGICLSIFGLKASEIQIKGKLQ